MSKLLNFEQKQRRMDIVQDILMTFNGYPDMLKTERCDKSGVFDYDIETKDQSS